ncbi:MULTISPECIES: GNAT family N-acetyltransferase [unclassified Curtobacterium]|uniref:GNAT family N-acetyltransferase n=1 Tax=unclassified Curtobacterium TaxID=257496 RepID=UPI000DAAA5A0|nr:MULTISPECIES: GNAT family N-acetyltransferase [unclassified Curtobacterium]WIB64342.1 N-acetyltransferase family protein [Curtobacterium sp. MCBD17_040]WIB68204.1 N-acetyltransferase family protein [Curtobacterium sp. MCBD17_035]
MTTTPPDVVVRHAEPDDLDVVHALHREAVLHSTAIWRDEPLPRAWFDDWLAERRRDGFPVFVAEADGAVAGYVTYGPWRENPGYRWTVEDSIYLDARFHGRGIASTLLGAAIDHAVRAGRHVMIADIASDNAASIRLHQRFGFEHVATVREVGRKFDRWHDLVVMRRALA